MIREVKLSDAPAIAEIYNYYILNTFITFEEEAIDAQEVERRIQLYTARYPWFVVDTPDLGVVGYAYATGWHTRAAYRHSAEISAYLAFDQGGKGYGSMLYDRLLSDLPKLGIHTVIAGVSLPNQPSIALLEKYGFEKTSHLREVGYKQNRWIDVGYWQLFYPTQATDPGDS